MVKTRRMIIEVDEERCDGCGLCVSGCGEGALQIVEGKARVVTASRCDGLGACIGECPSGALRLVEAEVEPFASAEGDEGPGKGEDSTLPCGCPSAHVRIFERPSHPRSSAGRRPPAHLQDASALTHWPVQIRLIPPDAPFLRGADLLVLADCTAVAHPNLHQDLLKGKAVMMGCPKFDDVDNYERKFTAIFAGADIRSVTVVVMEVPCCSGMPVIVRRGMEKAGKTVPLRVQVVGIEGGIWE